jgi:hypothetical protein
VIGLLIAAVLVACGGSAPECRVGAECASGICLSNGRCQVPADAGADAGDPGPGDISQDAGQDGEGTPDSDGAVGEDQLPADGDGSGNDGSISCSPNHDQVIERAEVPIRAGLHATFKVALDVDLDTAGVQQPDGSRAWDLSGALTGDHLAMVELLSLTGQWFAPKFPAGTYYTALRDGQDQLGVFQVTEQALLLLGVVTADDGVYRTELTYDPPVVVLAFPLQEGKTWTTESTVTGWNLGGWGSYWETYESQVDAHGELLTPFGTFQVLRINVKVTRTVGMLVTLLRSHLLVAECFGTVATVHSPENESNAEFNHAAEVRRLSP